MSSPAGGDQPDPSALPTILIGAIGTLVTVLILIFCQIVFRVTERNETISEGTNIELLQYQQSEANRLQGGVMPIDEAMQAVVQEQGE